jgi:hypothetical protein
MTLDGQTAQDVRTDDALPLPRTPGRVVGEAAWVEPWLFPRSSRPGSQYWDLESARWVTRSPVPGPRQGD